MRGLQEDRMIHALAFATLALALSDVSASAAPSTSTFADIDRQFVCPEALPDDATRTQALKAFMTGVSQAAPNMNIAQVLLYRRTLLTKHGCAATLRSLEAVDRAVADGDVTRQTWFPMGPNDGPVKLFVSATFLRPFEDPRGSDERAVETYTRMAVTPARETNVTHVTWDELISHNIYYCRSGRFALVENDYFLAGRPVLKDPSPVQAKSGDTKLFEIAPITPGSPNATAARWACEVMVGAVANREPGPTERG
jgi:hypothetical protein